MNLNKLIAYFDPYSHIRDQGAQAMAATGDTPPSLPWIPQYLALAAGVFIQPYLASYQVKATWDFSGGWGRVLFSLLIAVVIFPAVFRKTVDEGKPIIFLLGTVFTAGLGWQSLAGAAMKLGTQ